MRYAMCCVALSMLWSLAAVAGGTDGRITFVGTVVTPTCDVATSVVRPVLRPGAKATGVRACGLMHQGRFVPIARYRVITQPVSARCWLPKASILRLLGRSDVAVRRQVKLVTRNYL